MSINLGTTEVELSLYYKALQPRAHVTVTLPPDGSVEKAVKAGVYAFQKAFNESMESRNV